MAELKNIIDIIVRLKHEEQFGSKADRSLATLVLLDMDYASKASISEIARRVGVSEPTVTRFCRNLGCEGMRDFKFWLAQAIAVGGQYISSPPDIVSSDNHRIPEMITEAAVASIKRLVTILDVNLLSQASEKIRSAKQVLCIGSGGTSSLLALELQNRLFRLGLAALTQVDGQLQRMYAAVATSDTCLVAFSTSGHAQSVVDATQIARQYGATTVAITAAPSPLAQAAELIIPYQSAEDGNIYKPTSSRYALLALVDMLAMQVAEQRGAAALEGLRRIKQSLTLLKTDNPRLPIGD